MKGDCQNVCQDIPKEVYTMKSKLVIINENKEIYKNIKDLHWIKWYTKKRDGEISDSIPVIA